MAQKALKQLEESSTKRPKRASAANQLAIAAIVSASAPDKWSVENEVLLLETFLRISEDLGVKPSYEQIYEAVQGFIPISFSTKERVGTKLRHLKRKFLRTHAAASPPLDDLVYQLSAKIWGEAAGFNDEEAVDAEEVEAEVEAEAEENHVPVSAQPKLKRKTMTTSAVSVPQVQQEDDMTFETGPLVRSPRGQIGTSVHRPHKALAKSKNLGLIATGRPSVAVELDDRHMLPGLVSIVQQSYSDADEKLVRTALESMEPPHAEEFRKDWHKLQLLKLEVASRTSHMAAELLGVLHRKAAASGVSDG